MNKTKVDDLGRTSVPSTIRKLLNINKGDKLIWKHEEGKVIVEKDEEGKDAEEIIEWLQEKAPECGNWEPQARGDKIEGLDLWSKKKLGLKE